MEFCGGGRKRRWSHVKCSKVFGDSLQESKLPGQEHWGRNKLMQTTEIIPASMGIGTFQISSRGALMVQDIHKSSVH